MAKYDLKAKEEEIKNLVARDFFGSFDATRIIGDIDFCVSANDGTLGLLTDENTVSYLWAESKKGNHFDIIESFVQLVLTIGKARTFDRFMPPAFLGAFDAEKIAFVQYNKIMHVFYQNDFNWNVTPSDHESKEFKQLQTLLQNTLENENFKFDFEKDEKELKEFIKKNLASGTTEKIQVTKNNFIAVYYKWLERVMPSIAIDWEEEKKEGVIPTDFYLADLISIDNVTESIATFLSVRLDTNRYFFNVEHKKGGKISMDIVQFNDRQKSHKEFWKNYERPPKEEYKSYILDRRDLLIPQDIRERKGSFFTPQKWVDLSMEYIEKVLGENWQDEYYVWDCCCGTGNLLAKMTNPVNVFASTLDSADVDVIKENIQEKKSNLFSEQVFQFDFLNDDLQSEKVPERLRKILADENERKKLVIYINPPYAEASNGRTNAGTGENRKDLSKTNVREKYLELLGRGINELFAQFLIRIYFEIADCFIGHFSTLKVLQGPNFKSFRNIFKANLEKSFIVPASTFDNVSGQFPIGFFIWNTSKKENFTECETDIFDSNACYLGTKKLYSVSDNIINKWLHTQFDLENEKIAWLRFVPNDFQNNQGVYITNSPNESDIRESRITGITKNNLIPVAVYFSVRHCIEKTWINNQDNFLFPKDTWKSDLEFQSDCLAYTLFHGKNRISFGNTSATDARNVSSQTKSNPRGNSIIEGKSFASSSSQLSTLNSQFSWIPFSEKEVGNNISPFESHFMFEFINGKLKRQNDTNTEFEDALLGQENVYDGTKQMEFSFEAKSVIDAGREIWKYYFEKPHVKSKETTNASFYDIRLSLQGETNGRMNSTSTDEKYNTLIADLRAKQKTLAKKISLKVYEHGFLK